MLYRGHLENFIKKNKTGNTESPIDMSGGSVFYGLFLLALQNESFFGWGLVVVGFIEHKEV